MILAGLLLGLAVISEYPIGVVVVVLFAYIWLVFPRQRLLILGAFILGMIPSVLLLGWYDWFAFGNPFHLSYAYVSDAAFAGQHDGFFGITTPHLDSLWSTMAFPRGLLMESPFLLLIPFGLIRLLRASHKATAAAAQKASGARAAPALRRRLGVLWTTIQAPGVPEALVSLAVILLYPLAISSYFLPMAGENLPGPRLLVPMLPFACLALAWVVDHPRRWLRVTLAVSLIFGVAMSFLFVALGVRIFHTYGAFPWNDLYWPLIRVASCPRKMARPRRVCSRWRWASRTTSHSGSCPPCLRLDDHRHARAGGPSPASLRAASRSHVRGGARGSARGPLTAGYGGGDAVADVAARDSYTT